MGGNGCNSEIVKYYVVQPPSGGGGFTGTTGDFTIGGDLYVCTTGSTIYTNSIDPCNTGVTISGIITINTDGTILPVNDNVVELGSPITRFRNVNTISGTSTVWTSTNQIITPNLNLGLDLSGNTRIITADNSIIQDDTLSGGSY